MKPIICQECRAECADGEWAWYDGRRYCRACIDHFKNWWKEL